MLGYARWTLNRVVLLVVGLGLRVWGLELGVLGLGFLARNAGKL